MEGLPKLEHTIPGRIFVGNLHWLANEAELYQAFQVILCIDIK